MQGSESDVSATAVKTFIDYMIHTIVEKYKIEKLKKKEIFNFCFCLGVDRSSSLRLSLSLSVDFLHNKIWFF